MNYSALVVLIVLCFVKHTSAESSTADSIWFQTIQISPSCDDITDQNDSCLTLSQYAAKVNSYIYSNANISLVLETGTHYLNETLRFVNGALNMTGSGFVNVYCNDSETLIFYINNSYVSIENVNFKGFNSNSNYVTDLTLTGGPGAIFADTSNITVSNSSFDGTGGAIFAFSSNITVSNSSFDGNSAEYGGAIEIVFYSTAHIENCLFGNNNASHYGGSISIVYKSNATIKNSEFTNNFARYGGAITILYYSTVHAENCSFRNNNALQNGGAICISIRSHCVLVGEITFANNAAKSFGGALYTSALSTLTFTDTTCNIVNNSAQRGGGIFNSGSTTEVLKLCTITFKGNKATQDGGGMYFDLDAEIVVMNSWPGSNCLDFIENEAKFKGGAMYVNDYSVNYETCAASFSPDDDQNVLHSSDCFIQIFDSRPVTVNFRDNSADLGNSLYGGLLDRCQLFMNSDIKIINDGTEVSEIPSLNEDDFTSGPVRLCLRSHEEAIGCCKGADYSYTLYRSVKRGEEFEIGPLIAVDQFCHPVNASVIGTLASQNSKFLPIDLYNQSIITEYSELKYRLQSKSDISTETLILYADGPCRDIGYTLEVDITLEMCECPPGFKEDTSSHICKCECNDENLEKYLEKCNVNDNNTLTRNKFWVGTNNDTEISLNETQNQCFMTYFDCPLDYCSDISLIDLNQWTSGNIIDQCTNNRKGDLCGNCQTGYSVGFSTSKCLKDCSNNYILLLLAFACAGIVLVAFILTFNLTVAVGTINGLIFYANIIVTDRIDTKVGQSPLTIFVSWLNLDLGIETCFYRGMDEYFKTWLQYAFPLYVLFLVVLIIILCERFRNVAKLFSKKNPVATLATLILLLYVKFLTIIITTYSVATVYVICPNETDSMSGYQRRWYVDGSIDYFGSKHAPLFIVATIVLILGFVYTFVLLFGQWFTHIPDRRGLGCFRSTKLNLFLEAYFAPYNPKHRYWTGLLLLARIVVYLIPTFVKLLAFTHSTSNLSTNLQQLRQVNILSIFSVSLGLLLWKLVVGRIYRQKLFDILDSLFLVFLILYVTASLLQPDNNEKPVYALAGLLFTIFILILIYHAYKFVLLSTTSGKKIKTKIRSKFVTDKTPKQKKVPKFRKYSPLSLFPSASLDRNLRTRVKPADPVTYSEIKLNILPEPPLSQQLGHYRKKESVSSNSKNKITNERLHPILEENKELSTNLILSDSDMEEENAMVGNIVVQGEGNSEKTFEHNKDSENAVEAVEHNQAPLEEKKFATSYVKM